MSDNGAEEFDVVVVGAGFAGLYLLHLLRGQGFRTDLRRDIRFETRVAGAVWNETDSRWTVTTERGDILSAQHYIMATGCLSTSKLPEIPGVETYAGESYHTGRWPHVPVDFAAKRVGVIGTGSSAIQSIPIIAEQAAQVTVFQRTPNFSVPASNGPNDADELAAVKARYPEYREGNRASVGGVPLTPPERSVLEVSDQEREAAFESGWAEGGIFALSARFNDLRTDEGANEHAAEFVRNKIRAKVNDPEVAEILCPTTYPFGTKRLCVDSHYFETYNRDNVRLVDLRQDPITSITPSGINTEAESFEFDALVFATGFDAMTGTIVAVDIEGVGGLTIKDKWADGPLTNLGLMVAGFPNFFTVTGPGSPSVLSNMMVSIEQHAEWITDCIVHLRENGLATIESTEAAEGAWVRHVNELADATLMKQANSWYLGANVPGKPRVFMPYIGGVGPYRDECNAVVADGYRGFALSS
ncbi:MAG: NAD(P)/FAD-dependent oxidoreductase [Actinomycetia bacterium]|nr:NAD(P)/FAD-dependent oxidoreductase [Actinomycetes bacterium]